MRRRPRWISAALALALCTACTTDGSDDGRAPASEASPSATPPAAEPPRALLYLDGRDIRRFDLASGKDRSLGRAPSSDAAATTDGARVAYVVSRVPGPSDEDFIASPELVVADVESGELTQHGAGLSALWHHDGSQLAALVPAEARGCEGETCEGRVAVVVIDSVSGERRTVVEPDHQSLLGWWGDRLLVGTADPPAVLAVSRDGSQETLTFAPNEVWAPSPTGDALLVVDELSASFTSGSAGRTRRIPLGGSLLGEGEWAPDGKAVVAVRLEGGRSELVLLDAERATLEPIPGSGAAQGQVVWAPDSSAFAYSRAVGGREFRLQAMFCEVKHPVACEGLFDWGRGVQLLALLP